MGRKIHCEIHGMAPAYMVCNHILEHGARVFWTEPATEDSIGQKVCEGCLERKDLTADDGKIICADCSDGKSLFLQ